MSCSARCSPSSASSRSGPSARRSTPTTGSTTSGRLIQNETIREALGDYLVDQLYENVDVEKELSEKLPGDTKDLAGTDLRWPAPGRRRRRQPGAEELDRPGTLEERQPHHARTAAGSPGRKGSDAVSTEEGKVSLNLGSLVTNLADQVGIGADLAEKLPPDAGQITILRSDQLKTAQDIVVAIKGLALILSLLTFLCFGLAIYLSREGRWVTVLSCGIGLIAAGFAVIVAREIAGGIVVGQLVEEDSVKPAAEAAWSIGTSLMTSIATTVIVIGVLFGDRRLARLADRLGPRDPPRHGPGPARLRRLRLRRPGDHRRHLLPLRRRPRTCAPS